MLNIVCDLDGVLCEYNKDYAMLLVKTSGRDLFPKGWQDEPELVCPVWDYDQHFGYTDAEIAAAMDIVIYSSDFWRNLHPVPGARAAIRVLGQLAKLGHNVYFLTSRVGVTCKRQAEQWLFDMGMDMPTVIISHDKVPFLKSLGKVDLFMDDKLSTVDAAIDVVSGKTVLIDQPYNQARNNDIIVYRTALEAINSIL